MSVRKYNDTPTTCIATLTRTATVFVIQARRVLWCSKTETNALARGAKNLRESHWIWR